jgi:hypothetical protein
MTTISFGLKPDIIYKEGYNPDDLKKSMRIFFATTGAELQTMFKRQSDKRADGKGGRQGAHDLGGLNNSIYILSTDYDHVIVGTNLKRARMLAEGTPDPSARLDWIRLWRKRKNVPRRAVQVWNKVRTKGPIPNPFHKRTKAEFKAQWNKLKKEAKL